MNRLVAKLGMTALFTALLLGSGVILQACFIQFPDDDDDTNADDDDTSAFGDDDTSVGDDDTSVGDDDTSTQCADDSYEENDSIPTASVVAPGVFPSLVVCPSDDDYYRLSVQPGDMLVVRATFAHDEGDIDMTVTDPEGLTFSGVSTDDNEEVSTEASAGSGIFIVKITLYNDTGVPGNGYQLDLSAEPYLGDDDDAGDDDDSLNCAGPTSLGGTVDLTDTAGGPSTGIFSVSDPLTVNIQLEHLSGADMTLGWNSFTCLANVLLIDPLFPNANQDQLQMRGHPGCSGFAALTCGAAPHQASVTIVPFGFASYDFSNPPPACCHPNPSSCPDISLCGSPLLSGVYQLEVDFDPTNWPTLDSILNPQPIVVTIREGAVTDATADDVLAYPDLAGTGECEDSNDNDQDGLIDCADPDCAGKDGCP